jgi:NAD-dependent SIR2 family protein deacetylase
MARKRRGVTPPPFVPPPPPRDAQLIPLDGERMDCSCDFCGKRFYVNAVKLRKEAEIELRCPYCERKMLIQHVEYACGMVIE